MFKYLIFAISLFQNPVEFRPGHLFLDSPDDAAYAAATFLKSAIEIEQKSKNLNPLLRSSNLRFISAYNLSTTGTRRKLGSKTAEAEQFSPLDDAVKVLLFAVNQVNRVNSPVTLIKVKDDLFAVYLDGPGWTASAWDELASKDVYFRREWIHDTTWNYLTYYTYTEHPIMRIDQFISLATVPPDYYSLLGLPKTLAEFQKLIGVNEKLLTDSNRIKAGVKTDGLTVTFNNRRLEFRQGVFDLWTSFDVINSKGNKNALRQLDVIGGKIHDLDIDGNEHIFQLGNGLVGGFLNNAKGERVDAVPPNIAGDENYRDHQVIAGRSCITCHDLGIKSFESDQAALLANQVIQLRTINPQDAIALASRYDERSVQRIIKAGQEQFRSAVEDITGTAPEKMAAMYASLWRRYNEDRVTLHVAALESGLSDDGFTAILVPSIEPNLLGLISKEGGKGSIARDIWEDTIDDVLLLKGRPVPPKDRIQLPVVDLVKLKKLETPIEHQEEFSIIGKIVLVAPKVVGEVQTSKIVLKTKNPSVINGYVRDGTRISLSTSPDSLIEHELSFTFTASEAGLPTQVKIELDHKFIEIPVTVQ